MDFAVPSDYGVKFKESERKDENRYLAREVKKPPKNKQWNVKVTVIPILNDALSKVTKWLVQGLEDFEIRGRVETIQTTALLR